MTAAEYSNLAGSLLMRRPLNGFQFFIRISTSIYGPLARKKGLLTAVSKTHLTIDSCQKFRRRSIRSMTSVRLIKRPFSESVKNVKMPCSTCVPRDTIHTDITVNLIDFEIVHRNFVNV